MAPRRGGGSSSGSDSGSGSGGSSSCYYCNQPLELFGHDWKDATTDASFAIEIIVLLVLFACIPLALRFKWVRQHGTDSLRTIGFSLATICTIIYYIVNVVNTGLAEAGTSTTYLYYLVFIFSSFFWRVSELIILAIIIRTIAETGILSKTIKPANILAIVVLAVLSAASYGIYVANTVDIIRNGPYSIDDDNYLDLQLDQWHVSLAYQVVYLLVSIVAGIVGLLAIFKERSKQALIMAVFILPALFLRSLMGAIFGAVYDAALTDNGTSLTFKVLNNLNWANTFIYDLTNAAIFIGVGVVGCLRPKNAGLLQEKGYGNAQQHPIAYD